MTSGDPLDQGMELVGLVSTEGGPLLIADRDAATNWTGVFGSDYERASLQFDERPNEPGFPFRLRDGEVILWQVPTGSAEVWRLGHAQLEISRPWQDQDTKFSDRLASLPRGPGIHIGEVEIHSGWLLIMWSAEEGREAVAVPPRDGVSLDLSLARAGLVIALPEGRYALEQDYVESSYGSSLRCFIDPM